MSLKHTKHEQFPDETLDELLVRLNIKQFDLLLIGDGSGCNWKHEIGWGCVSIDGATLARKAWYGSMSAGTVNLAEMMAYLQPICWYVDREIKRRKQANYKTVVRHIHIITDSQYVKTKGSSSDMLSGKSGPLWQVFKQFEAQGMMLHWHWVRRETVELNKYADHLSKHVRLNIKNKDLAAQVEDRMSRNIYGFNPSE